MQPWQLTRKEYLTRTVSNRSKYSMSYSRTIAEMDHYYFCLTAIQNGEKIHPENILRYGESDEIIECLSDYLEIQ